jgi:mannitol-1-phosphate/altronate dehydrogenase
MWSAAAGLADGQPAVIHDHRQPGAPGGVPRLFIQAGYHRSAADAAPASMTGMIPASN